MARRLHPSNRMAHRNRELNIALAIGQLVGLVMVFGLLSPQYREKIHALGSAALSAIAIVAVVLLCGLVAYATLGRRRRAHANTEARSPCAAPASTSVNGRVDLGQRIRGLDWYQFEKLVALIYQRQGYAVTRRGGANPDGGIDLILERDEKRIAVQCKHWQKWKVGVKTLREFLGALTAERIPRGILVTVRGYTNDAKRLAAQHSIELVDGTGLISFLNSARLQTDQEFLRLLHDKRKLCPKCESEMVLRTSKKGSGAGNQFWGCSTFPKCRFTLPAE